MQNNLDELTSLIKAMDTKIMFIMDDLEQVKKDLESMQDTLVQTAMMISTSGSNTSSDNSKSQRLEAFRQQTARW